METQTDKVDRLLQRNPELAEMVREIEWLLSEHQRLVAEGKVTAYKLMGLTRHNVYSATQEEGKSYKVRQYFTRGGRPGISACGGMSLVAV